MTDAERDLLALLTERSFKKGTFKLSSGGESTYYIDGKMTQVFSRGARLLGEVLYEQTCNLKIDAIGGLEVGAVPLATAAVIAYDLHGRNMEGFWVRDRLKSHGTKKMIEGNVKPGSRVVIVDDVITRGESSGRAITEVEAFGCEVVLVLAIVDRLAGAEAFFRDRGVENYRSVFTIRDFGVEIRDVPGPTALAGSNQ